MGIDPLASTYKWLERAYNRLKTNDTIGWYQIPLDTAAATTTTSQNQSPLAILNEAYCEILLWEPKNSFPEVNSYFVLFNSYSLFVFKDIRIR